MIHSNLKTILFYGIYYRFLLETSYLNLETLLVFFNSNYINLFGKKIGQKSIIFSLITFDNRFHLQYTFLLTTLLTFIQFLLKFYDKKHLINVFTLPSLFFLQIIGKFISF